MLLDVLKTKAIKTLTNHFDHNYKNGVSVDVCDIVVKRGMGKKAFTTSNHISLSIKPGEMVAIIGNSGTGKTTLLDCMCGYLRPTQGKVFINGIDLYQNFNSLRNLIGYVPQSNIVYDNLTLYDMLMYTAKLRLPNTTTPEELESVITRAIDMVELSEKRNNLIKSLSGGQQKRASIAVELVSDPSVLFLDEPTSGLDPGTERHLMRSLQEMADCGRTIVLVTHSILQLKMCDKIAFISDGGDLCFYGSYNEMLTFFNTSDIVDVYKMINKQAKKWRTKFEQYRVTPGKVEQIFEAPTELKKYRLKQLHALNSRYLLLLVNNKQRVSFFLAQAPLLAVLISFVANGKQFDQYEITQKLLFVLSCSAFWVGILNALLEICKERIIVKREYMCGLSLSAYILSKIIVLGFLCLIQSVLMTIAFSVTVGLPKEGVLFHPFIELLITTFFTSVSSAATGLFVSSLFTHASSVMTTAPILLVPQILFSGVIFKLSGISEIISWMIICHWSIEGYGTTANFNNLPLRLQQEGVMITHEAESFYEFTASHLLTSWGILVLYTIVFLVITRIALSKLSENKPRMKKTHGYIG